MDQASREAALRRIEAGLDRLAAFVGGLQQGGVEADMVSREAHETLLAAHQLLRTRAEAAVAGIDRLLKGSEPDRQRVVSGTSVSGRVELGGRRIIIKQKNKNNIPK